MINLALSWGLLVLIWIVQIIIYPGLAQVPTRRFVAYHRWYVKRIGAIAGPLMAAEAAAVLWWLHRAPSAAAWVCTGLVLCIWLASFLLQVPIHRRLQSGKDRQLIRRLVATNWIRTTAWTLKALVVTTTTAGGPH